MSSAAPLLEVEDLEVRTPGRTGVIVRGVSLTVAPGECVGVVGESGSGKTTLGLGLMGATRRRARITGGSVRYLGRDLLRMSDAELRTVRAGHMAYVPQNPAGALNPFLRIGAAMRTVLRRGVDREVDVASLLETVGLPSDEAFQRRYPHELSGGQQQRVLIALAVAARPELVIMDEPTTALDVTTQASILDLVRVLSATQRSAIVYVSHDLAVVSELAERVVVMYGGMVVEQGPRDAVLASPRHPYTVGLIRALATLDRERRLPQGIPGSGPGVGWSGGGCVFFERCGARRDECRQPQVFHRVSDTHEVRCVRSGALSAAVSPRPQAIVEPHRRSAVLEVQALEAFVGGPRDRHAVVHAVSFDVQHGGCTALVGESGSGKTTIARCIAGLHRDWVGDVVVGDKSLAPYAADRALAERRRLQLVLQNPDESLNPSWTVARTLERPCVQLGGASRAEAADRVSELLELVQLPHAIAARYPLELSGGERQRVALARALAPRPDIIVCDEITSALDVSVQASILEMLVRLRGELGLSLLFISHDLGVVRAIADDVIVLRDGVIREAGETSRLLFAPTEEYTRALVAAVPRAPVAQGAGL